MGACTVAQVLILIFLYFKNYTQLDHDYFTENCLLSNAVVSGSNFQSFTTAERQQDCLWISLEAYAESPRATEIRNEAYV